MNRDQYFDRHRNLNIERELLERKWRAFQEEQYMQEQMRMFEAARAAAQSAAAVASGAGGGYFPDNNPKAIVESAKNVFIYYASSETNTIKFFVINYDNLTFSEEIDTGIDPATTYDYYINDMIDGKGWNFVISHDDDKYSYYFVDGGGNLIEKIDKDVIGNGYNSFGFEGYINGISYTDQVTEKVVVKYWNGSTIYTNTFDDVDNVYVYTSWFGGDQCTSDGVFSIYYWSTSINEWRIYLLNSTNGNSVEVTDIANYYNGENYDDSCLFVTGNFLWMTWTKYSSAVVTGCSYTLGNDYITLTSPNSFIRVGDEIAGPGLSSGIYVIEIAGTTIYVSQTLGATQTDVNVGFESTQLELLRIIKSDGSYIDFDLKEYYSYYIDYWDFIGSDKVFFYFYTPANQIESTLFLYNNTNGNTLEEKIDKEVYDSYQMLYNDALYPFDNYYESPAATETFAMIVYDNATRGWDGKMETFESVKFLWTNPLLTLMNSFEPTVGSPVIPFKISFNEYYYTTPITFFANFNGATALQLMSLYPEGTTGFVDLPTTYSNAGDYFVNAALGDDYTVLTYYDNSRSGDTQFWGIWNNQAGDLVDLSNIWTSTNNGWRFNYDTFYMTQFDEGKTYYWNSALGSLNTGIQNINLGYDTDWRSNRRDYYDYTNYHYDGTTALRYDYQTVRLLSSNMTPITNIDLSINGSTLDLTRVNKNNFFNAWQDGSRGNQYNIDVYDLEGTLVQRVETTVDSYNDFWVIADRIYFSNNGPTDVTIYAISPSTYATKVIPTTSGFSRDANDWRWW